MGDSKKSVRYLTEAALMVALALVLSRVKLFRMPQGGSVTLEMVPLMVLALRWNAAKGACAGAVLGLLQWMLSGYVVHPVQAVLDYPAAFAAMGLAGLFPSRPRAGIALAGLARYACHVATGVVFFGSYAPQGTGALKYSLVYNAGYMGVNTALALLITPILLKRLNRR